MKNLPIGISTLSTILENDMVYVDKTAYVHSLAAVSGRFFLSRPRRFGKSLFLDTLKSLFEGREELFRGLFIHDKWDWNRRHPVIKVDFAGGSTRNRAELELRLGERLAALQREFEVTLSATSVAGQFAELIQVLVTKTGAKAVVLVDEYDKPLLDNIEKSEVQGEVRDGLRDFYSVIKEQDALLQFVFLTGVSKFSKVSIFSGINNLEDITLDEHYAAACGYTEDDLDRHFGEHLAGVDRALLKRWYNGYGFLGEPVYNPFDILLFISKNHSFRPYWFETGTPSFLMRLFQQRQYFLPDLEGLEVGDEILSSFELEKIEPATLLFQTGYLTIKKTVEQWGRIGYVLGFPNFEVKTAFSDHLINAYTGLTVEKRRYQDAVYGSLLNADLPGLLGAIRRLFTGIAHRNFTNNDIADFEGWYASVLYAFFSSLDCVVIPEDTSNHGQTDLTVQLGDNIYVMELKVVKAAPEKTDPLPPVEAAAGSSQAADSSAGSSSSEGSNPALEQLRLRGYAAKYRGLPGKRVFELGLVFGRRERALVQWAWAELRE
jgi:hypothetical protein